LAPILPSPTIAIFIAVLPGGDAVWPTPRGPDPSTGAASFPTSRRVIVSNENRGDSPSSDALTMPTPVQSRLSSANPARVVLPPGSAAPGPAHASCKVGDVPIFAAWRRHTDAEELPP